MTFSRIALACLWCALAVPAAAQTADEKQARIAAIESKIAKLQQELATLQGPSRPRSDAVAAPAVATPRAAAAIEHGNAAYAKAAPPPAATGSWTGFYAGGNLGLSVGKNPTDSLLFRQVIGGGSIRSPETLDLSPQGGLAGLQAGVNWQLGRHFVLGTEADYQWSNASGSACVLSCSDPNLRSGGLVYHQTLSSFGTLRGRAGWSSGPSLLYLTGGLAYGHFDTTIFHTQTAAFGRTAEGKSGWTAGGGLESRIAGNLTAKVEYLYLDFGSTAGRALFDFAGAGIDTSTYSYLSHLHQHVFRTGLNYKFGDPLPAQPTLEPAGSRHEWAGFYAGVNGGAAVGRNPSRFLDVVPTLGPPFVDDQVDIGPVGGFVGVQAGYLARIAPDWVAGVEADWQSAHLRDPTTCFVRCASSEAVGLAFLPPSISINSMTQHEDWFATFRARTGWSNGATLFYATGGAALGRIVTDVNLTGGSLVPYNVLAQGNASFAVTKWGWTAGGGIETALAPNWSLKGEYLYMNFGQVSGSLPRNTQGLPETVTVSSELRNHLFRLGVNYRLDGLI